MNINDVYKSSSDHLKADDIPPGKQVQLTIASYEVVEFDDKPKIVLAFNSTDKTLVLNKTNATAIAAVHGPDTDSWAGKSIFVYSTKVDFGGKMVDAIRVDLPRETVQQPQQVQQPQLDSSADFDDIPF